MSVAEFREGNLAQPSAWMSIPREDPDVASSIGIVTDSLNDFVTVRLRNGRTVTIYADGQLWFHGANYIFLNSDDLPWK